MSAIFPFNDADQPDFSDRLRRIAAGGRRPATDLTGAPVLRHWHAARRFAPALVGLGTGHPIMGANRTLTSEQFAIDPDAGWARTFRGFCLLVDRLPDGNGRRQ